MGEYRAGPEALARGSTPPDSLSRPAGGKEFTSSSKDSGASTVMRRPDPWTVNGKTGSRRLRKGMTTGTLDHDGNAQSVAQKRRRHRRARRRTDGRPNCRLSKTRSGQLADPPFIAWKQPRFTPYSASGFLRGYGDRGAALRRGLPAISCPRCTCAGDA